MLIDDTYQYKKKSWVPDWLWNLVAIRDPTKLIAERLTEAKRDSQRKLEDAIQEVDAL